MAFILALLGCLVAGDVVELEPLKISPGNKYGCNAWSGSDAGYKPWCEELPYCTWSSAGSGNYKCYDDPCLRIMSPGETCPSSVPVQLTSSVDVNVECTTINSLADRFKNGDCGDVQEVYDLCAQKVPDADLAAKLNTFTYCTYAKLRDNTCPDSVCKEYDLHSQNSLTGNCIPSDPTITGCAVLATEKQCGLVPKCYWKSNSVGCVPDPCWTLEGDITGVCADYKPDADSSVTCKEFKPFKLNGAGSVDTYCVISANSKPNLCYLGTPNSEPLSADDYTYTYPTLNISSTGTLLEKPSCAPTATSCSNMGTCQVVVNKQGALAGTYCSDGEHGAANILRIPSLFVILLTALCAIFNF